VLRGLARCAGGGGGGGGPPPAHGKISTFGCPDGHVPMELDMVRVEVLDPCGFDNLQYQLSVEGMEGMRLSCCTDSLCDPVSVISKQLEEKALIIF
jgi:hypothetical protein